MELIYGLIDALLPFEFLRYSFMKNALIAMLLLTPLLSLLGTMAVNQRMAFFSDALGHSALAGVGIGMLLGVGNVTLSLVAFGVVYAILVSTVNRSGAATKDTTISVFSSMGIALGLLLLSRGGKFSSYTSLLTGDILSIEPNDLTWLLAGLVIGVAIWCVLYNLLLVSAVSPELAESRGIRTRYLEYAFAVLVAVAVMLAIRWVGVLLINALLILPAAAARNVSRSAAQHALWSVLFGLVSGIAGLVISYGMNTGVGAAVVLCAGLIYFVTLLIRRFTAN